MEELMQFTGIVMIAFGILQIILFFKVWGMTNNVKGINNKIIDNSLWVQAGITYIKGDIEETNRLLNESFIYECVVIFNSECDYATWSNNFQKLEDKYTRAFKKIEKPVPDFYKYRLNGTYLG